MTAIAGASTNTGNALAIPPLVGSAEIDQMIRLSTGLYRSGYFKGVNSADQALTKMLIGRDLGISPTQSLISIDLVKGNIQLRSVLLASFVRRSPDYDYRVVEHGDEKCAIEFRRLFDGEWESLGVSTFTLDDAERAKLVRNDSAWQTAPRNMVFARAMSNGVKWFAPDLLGGVPVYTEGDDFDEIASTPPAPASGPPDDVGPADVEATATEPEPDKTAELLDLYDLAGQWGVPDLRVKALLVAAGAQDTNHIPAAIGALAPDGAAQFEAALRDAVEAKQAEPVKADEKP